MKHYFQISLTGFRVSWSTVATKQENSLLKCQANAQLLVEGWELLLWPFIYATVGPRFLHDCVRPLSLAPTTCCQVSALLGVTCCLAVGIPKQHLGAAAAAWWEYARHQLVKTDRSTFLKSHKLDVYEIESQGVMQCCLHKLSDLRPAQAFRM